jgi:glycerophosphoryl diester phosphodiesterase
MRADGIELDVQLTKDGVPVICHDHSVNRTSNGQGWIKDHTLAEIKRLDFGSWFHQDFSGETIPTLDEFLQWFASTGMRLNIEIKNGPVIYPEIESKVIEAVKQYDLVEQVFISSFYHPSLLTVKLLCPEIKTGALFTCRPIDPLKFSRQIQADYLHPAWESMDAVWMREAKHYGIQIHTFTINQRDQYEFVVSMGADAIFTDYPDIWPK